MQNLGLVAIGRGKFAEAIELLERSLELFRLQNRQNLEAEVYWALGRAKEGLGDRDAALLNYEKALSLCQKLSYLDFEWRALWGRGNILAATDRREEAREALTGAISVIEQLRKQLPEGANLKAFQDDKQPVYDLMAELQETL